MQLLMMMMMLVVVVVVVVMVNWATGEDRGERQVR